ncbi:PP2C family protein-serine/threonine phosphatase [Pseudofrankia inefficax]|uniref:Protein serine/threonine phosphatase n=1 Tax=Pseudofrankia inefficax (strain DSM 45817 / CECT 9037 / DDB 130130 / EuI1c) TaxID=298654 RepID=E3J9S7_PSEI1|nr:PP2C family protein-serine/threonine phosphatase [Pseudofrankia inefficax]ADP84580.1 protein serine/threonine phosphatase [Pseudofrankia inefficax]
MSGRDVLAAPSGDVSAKTAEPAARSRRVRSGGERRPIVLVLGSDLTRPAGTRVRPRDGARRGPAATGAARTVAGRPAAPDEGRHFPPTPNMLAAGRSRAAYEGDPGDFLDLFPTGPGRWGLVLGDVCGHDAKAAGLAAWARTTVRQAAGPGQGPRGVLGLLNTGLLRQAPDDERFLTAVYLDLRPARDGCRAVLCSAGHLPALIRRRDGTLHEAGTGGIVLGVTADPRLTETSLFLEPGDTVLLYTDGVTEACRGGERYGEQRLRQLLSRVGHRQPDVLARTIERTALEFGDRDHRDDITVAVLRIT